MNNRKIYRELSYGIKTFGVFVLFVLLVLFVFIVDVLHFVLMYPQAVFWKFYYQYKFYKINNNFNIVFCIDFSTFTLSKAIIVFDDKKYSIYQKVPESVNDILFFYKIKKDDIESIISQQSIISNWIFENSQKFSRQLMDFWLRM